MGVAVTEILAAIVGNSVVLAILGFLAKSIVERQLERDTRRFEVSLRASASKEIEQYRANLEKERVRLQISYGGIFEKQANAILELYQLAKDFLRDAQWAMNCSYDDKEEVEKFKQSWRELYDSYERLRVLLPEELDRKCRAFVEDYYIKISEKQRIQKRYERVTSDEAFERLWKREESLRTAIEKDMPALLEELVTMMRVLLGTSHQCSPGERRSQS